MPKLDTQKIRKLLIENRISDYKLASASDYLTHPAVNMILNNKRQNPNLCSVVHLLNGINKLIPRSPKFCIEDFLRD